jgi:hypothetical protein
MKKFLFSFALCTFFVASSQVMGCLPKIYSTTSQAAVTIKMGDTFLEIPERDVRYQWERVPMEKSAVHIDLHPSPSTYCNGFVLLNKALASTRVLQESVTNFNSDIAISPVHHCDLVTEITPYLEKISSPKKPVTWENDARLAGVFKLGVEPCGNQGSSSRGILSGVFSSLVEAGPSSEDILTGLQHRNTEIRRASAVAIARLGSNNELIRAAVLNMLKSEKDAYMVQEAKNALLGIADKDPRFIKQLRELVKNPDTPGRSGIANGLAKIDADFVTFILSLKVKDDPTLADIAVEPLANFVLLDYWHNKPDSLQSFTPQSRSAIAFIMERFFSSNDYDIRASSLENFRLYERFIISPKYISYLNSFLLSDDLRLVRLGVEVLERNGLKPKAPDIVNAHLKDLAQRKEASRRAQAVANLLIDKINKPLQKNTDNVDPYKKLRSIYFSSKMDDELNLEGKQ